LIENIATHDETIMECYLNDQEITADQLIMAIRRITINRLAVPVLCGSSYKYIGIQPLLDGIVQYLPEPSDLGIIKGVNLLTGNEASRERSIDTPLTAFVFKVVTDNYVGQLAMVRLYAGRLKAGDTIWNAKTGNKHRVSRILKVQADKYIELHLSPNRIARILVLPLGNCWMKTLHCVCLLINKPVKRFFMAWVNFI